MKQRLGIVTLCVAVALWCGAAFAQSQQQNVQITNGPTVQNVAADSANITWSTNVPAGSTVRYGTDPNKLDKRAQESWGGTNHTVQVKGLQPDTTYYYQVVSGQGLRTGSGMMGAVQSFKTAASGAAAATSPATPAPATPPAQSASATQNNESNISIVAGPIARQVKDTSAHIWWQTNSPSSTILMYGTDPNNVSQKAEKPWGKDSHSVQLTGLTAGTTYYFRVMTADGRELDKGSFQTVNTQQAQQQFQIIHGPAVEKLGPDSVVVAWTTSAPSSSIVKYGTDPNNLSQTAQAEWGQQTHRVTVNNLQPNTKYYFKVQSGQAQGTGQEMSSAVFPLTTEAPGSQARVFNTR